MKPLCAHEYNQNRGSVDRTDMQISFSASIRKTMKWYKKLFFHFLDLSLLDAYLLYKRTKQVNIELTDFRLQVIRQIFAKYESPRDSAP